MVDNTTYDFDQIIDRSGTWAEKYEARKRLFGTDAAEPFWVADMDLPTPQFVVDAMARRLSHPIFGYTETDAGVFDAVLWWMKHEHGLAVEKQWIRLSPSVVTSMSIAVQALSNPGDSIAFLSPVYGPFFSTVRDNNRTPVDLPMRLNGDAYEIDFASLEDVLSRKETTLFMLCNPHNPGGRLFTPDELTTIAALCRRNNVLVFSDEIHCDIVFPPGRHTSILSIPSAQDICIAAFSIGKLFNTSGLNASFVIIPDPQCRARFADFAGRAHCGDVNLLGKVALATALSASGAAYKKQLVDYIHENTRGVVERLRRVDGLRVMPPQATYLVWADFRAFGSPARISHRLIHDASVLLSGGSFFGPPGDGWFRMNCAHPRVKLYPAAERIAAMLMNTCKQRD